MQYAHMYNTHARTHVQRLVIAKACNMHTCTKACKTHTRTNALNIHTRIHTHTHTHTHTQVVLVETAVWVMEVVSTTAIR